MPSDPVIRVLPDTVINKIAAGEVVDRPASVVKELMENALDAGARSITVSVVDGGLKLIEVADDGCGMDRDNALLSVERHATSKIISVDDIEKIATLGFRGEALAAIASVSRFELITRRSADLSGTCIRINGGRMEDIQQAGCPPGTAIRVRQLFYNVPARRKFLKTAATELNHIRQVFLLYAMGRPDTGLRLVVDEREVYRLDAGSCLEDRIRQLFGPGLMSELRPVDWTDGEWGVRGLISSPSLTRSDKSEQYLFVNDRPASAPVLGYAVGEAYASFLPRGRHPVLFLFLDLPHGEVDVNVHPTKKEVRFRKSTKVRDCLLLAMQRALAMPSAPGAVTQSRGTAVSIPHGKLAISDFLQIPDLPVLPAFDYPARDKSKAQPATPDARIERSSASESMLADRGMPAPWRWCRILGQISNYFVVLETDEGMLLLDPQAAHERVLYEKMQAMVAATSVTTQGLLVPETVQLSPVKAGLIRKFLRPLGKLGFGISEFGGDTFMVEYVPAMLGDVSAGMLLDDIASELEAGGKSLSSEDVFRDHVIRVASRMAVRTTTQLNREALEHLVAELVMTSLPYTSPRGRPTVVFTSLQEIRKKFGRD